MQHILRVKRFHLSALCILLFVLLYSCARQGAPAGGPKDTRPPQVDTTASTPNFSTRFDKKRIELKFDEWIVLSDALTQVVISPPLAKRPEVVLKGRTVVVNMDKEEVLRPNTTYTINFGTAVKDLHEGNAAKDLRFVFSTGDFIDSLRFRGIVTDAFTGEPLENISILLHESFADSAIRKERPYYFSRTDKGGLYEFQNLRAGTFRVVGIEDADQNLKWDGENERIAFRDEALTVNDSLIALINLKVFKNQPKFRLRGVDANHYGLVKLGFSIPITDYETQALVSGELLTLAEKTQDSLMLWYDLPAADTAWSLRFSRRMTNIDGKSGMADTIPVKKGSRSDFMKTHRIGFGDVQQSGLSGTRGRTPATAPKAAPATRTLVQTFTKPAVLPFNVPITTFDTSRWVLSADSSRMADFGLSPDSASPRRLQLQVAWKQGKSYTLTILPGGLTDFWKTSNTDTLVRIFNVLPEKQLGTLNMTLEKLHPGARYILQILNGTVLEEERTFTTEAETHQLVIDHLPVAGYTARLVEDRNRNGRWDTGDFNEHRQPEPVFNKKLDALRANWELEVTFSTDSGGGAKRKQ